MMMMRDRSAASLGTTTVGNRSPALTHLTVQEIDNYQMDLVLRDVYKRLNENSTFFTDKVPQKLPHFVFQELVLGKELGRGEFGIVYQVDALDPIECDCPRCTLKKKGGVGGGDGIDTVDEDDAASLADHNDDDDDDDDAISTLSDSSLIRATGNDDEHEHEYDRTIRDANDTYRKCYMQRRCIREGRPRYAVKRLRADFDDKKRQVNAAIDLAVEAKFLAAFKHPNIVRIRGTVDKPGHKDFMIIMDCLTLTLREKIEIWSSTETKIRRSAGFVWKRLLGPFQPHRASAEKTEQGLIDLYTEKLMAMYDLARGMKFLQSKRILFRDLKPENIAFDVRARVKIFDFGLATELKQKDLVDPPDGYEATGLTGSLRYMAPEVVLCKYYGFAADVYSYGIVFWETFSGKYAYEGMNFERHFEQVVLKGKRPNSKVPGVPRALALLMTQMWDPKPGRRVDFTYVCEFLKHQSILLRHDNTPSGHQHHLTDRTTYLMGQSARSQSNNKSTGS